MTQVMEGGREEGYRPLPLLEGWVQEAAQATAEAPIPRHLLRELLRDSIPGPASQAALYSNRTEAVMLPDGSLGILAACGNIGELLRLSTLHRQNTDAASPFIVPSPSPPPPSPRSPSPLLQGPHLPVTPPPLPPPLSSPSPPGPGVASAQDPKAAPSRCLCRVCRQPVDVVQDHQRGGLPPIVSRQAFVCQPQRVRMVAGGGLRQPVSCSTP